MINICKKLKWGHWLHVSAAIAHGIGGKNFCWSVHCREKEGEEKRKRVTKRYKLACRRQKKPKKQNKNETKTKQQTVTEILALQRNAEKQLSYKYLIAFLKVFMSHEIG